MRRFRIFRLIGIGFGLSLLAFAPAQAEPLAKELFGGKKLPAATEPAVHGFYSKGCFSGGVAIAPDGPHWQAMRLSRNRRWGHPELVGLIERLSREAAQDGWPGLLVGDISQPRGGPMLSGHASHQIGLDADVWFTPMPDRRMSVAEREQVSAVSMLKEGTLHVDGRKWTPAHEAVLRRAANYSQVERILVHPGIKKKLCDTVRGGRSWLRKIRPFWGHHYHFHIRISCPDGSPNCKSQAAPPPGEGCDGSLAWWFTEEPWKPAEGPEKPKARDVMTMAALPNACRAVLNAPAPPSEAAVTVAGPGDLQQATSVRVKSADPSSLLLSLQPSEVPLPTPRPFQ
ncbi:penicillin-insensitive murein endopeptidase [Chelativorans sp. YIM 93263]|uniref:penicillin-insensitive murein endopeptidase n=1 Tax=Chelativorans sp. YIM 93263 TaxID=2906648 RepID=UPI00237883A4|nr:penicillin-insensitive murein endopeptidase [Chelativorans sp. YIM 93263]